MATFHRRMVASAALSTSGFTAAPCSSSCRDDADDTWFSGLSSESRRCVLRGEAGGADVDAARAGDAAVDTARDALPAELVGVLLTAMLPPRPFAAAAAAAGAGAAAAPARPAPPPCDENADGLEPDNASGDDTTVADGAGLASGAL